MGEVIRKKVWPQYFDKLLSGQKKFELRLANFDIKEGDTMLLEEWDPKTETYTGRSVERKVTMILRTKTKDFQPWPKEEVEKYGYQVIGLE